MRECVLFAFKVYWKGYLSKLCARLVQCRNFCYKHICLCQAINTSYIMTSQSNFQPVAPARTDTVGSQSSSDMSASNSPTSPTSRAATEFFGAISARVRGRSRSRSRDASRKRAKSPMIPPPKQIAQPQHNRNTSTSTMASPTTPVRPSLHSTSRQSTSGSDMWRGRHSNDWLFGGWSATEAAKDLLNRRK